MYIKITYDTRASISITNPCPIDRYALKNTQALVNIIMGTLCIDPEVIDHIVISKHEIEMRVVIDDPPYRVRPPFDKESFR